MLRHIVLFAIALAAPAVLGMESHTSELPSTTSLRGGGTSSSASAPKVGTVIGAGALPQHQQQALFPRDRTLHLKGMAGRIPCTGASYPGCGVWPKVGNDNVVTEEQMALPGAVTKEQYEALQQAGDEAIQLAVDYANKMKPETLVVDGDKIEAYSFTMMVPKIVQAPASRVKRVVAFKAADAEKESKLAGSSCSSTIKNYERELQGLGVEVVCFVVPEEKSQGDLTQDYKRSNKYINLGHLALKLTGANRVVCLGAGPVTVGETKEAVNLDSSPNFTLVPVDRIGGMRPEKKGDPLGPPKVESAPADMFNAPRVKVVGAGMARPNSRWGNPPKTKEHVTAGGKTLNLLHVPDNATGSKGDQILKTQPTRNNPTTKTTIKKE